MLYSRGQLKSQIAQLAGITDTNGNYQFDTTTFPTEDYVNNILDDTIREICSAWDYTFLENSKSYPFYHIINNVQGVYLSGTSNAGAIPVSGSIVPYPSDVLNYSWLANNSVNNVITNFAGIPFTGYDNLGNSYPSTSVSGSVTFNNSWTGVGYVYQLDQDVDKFLAPGIVVAHAASGSQVGQGIIMANRPYEDIVRLIPIGNINASGTPTMYFELPGLGPTNTHNGKAIQFFPFPLPTYSGSNFIVNYKKKHVDLTDDNSQQNVIPEQYQNVIVYGALAKINQIRTPDRAEEYELRSRDLINKMRLWDANQPSKTRFWRDANYNTNSSYLYDNSTWLSLGDAPR